MSRWWVSILAGLFLKIDNNLREFFTHYRLGYLFHFGLLNLSLNPQSPEIQVKYRMVKMWTNFAKFGYVLKVLFRVLRSHFPFNRNPTPFGPNDDSMKGLIWKNVNATDVMNVPYLNINAKMEMKMNPDSERLKFWDSLYKKYNGNTLANTV